VAAAVAACGSARSPDSADAGDDAPTDASNDAPIDAGRDAANGEAAPPPDAGPFVPTAVNAELISTSPGRVLTPPAWNEHLPKLVGDGTFLYAVHTYFTDPVATRFAAILRRPAAPAIGAGPCRRRGPSLPTRRTSPSTRPDRGTTWTWHTIPIQGVPASSGDANVHGFTPVKPYTSPAIFDPDVLTFFFYGADANNGVSNSYLGEIRLTSQ
jgi:hypothetical protein